MGQSRDDVIYIGYSVLDAGVGSFMEVCHEDVEGDWN